jgi:hypothetical protein
VSSPNIPKIKRVPRFIAHIAKSINPIVEIVNRGLVVSTSSVIAEKQADGRIALRLSPQVVANIAAAAPPPSAASPSVLTAAYVSGDGYSGGDLLTAVGGTFTVAFAITVDAVDGVGVPTSWHWDGGYIYTAEPTNPVDFTGGLGTGAQFDLSWDF